MSLTTRENEMTWNAKPLVAACLAALMMTPAMAAAQDVPDVTDEPEEAVDDDLEAEEAEDRPWGVSGTVSMNAYQGLLASPANDTEYAGEIDDGSGAYSIAYMLTSVTPSYQWEDFEFSAQLAYLQWLTAGGGFNEPYEGRFQDISLSAEWAGYSHDGTGFTISPSFELDLPTSSRAQAMTMLASTSLGVNISRTFFDDLTLVYGLTGSRIFHEYTSPVMDIEEVGDEAALYRTAGTEAVEPGRFAVGGINTQWGLVNSLAAMFSMTDSLSATVMYQLSSGWSYNVTEDDEFASERQCTGRCPGRSATGRTAELGVGVLSLSYLANQNLTITSSLTTIRAPRTLDNKSYNFPFLDTNFASNASYLSLSFTGTY